MALAASLLTERKRVKVYELRENDWFDRGTGFCAVQSINSEGQILVESENEPERALLEVRVKEEDNYQKQQETLIVWSDPGGVDMALSFQEAEGCGIVWNTIKEVLQRLASGQDDTQTNPPMLPPAELKFLPAIEASIRLHSTSPQGRDTMAKLVIADNYLANLAPLVEMAEDLESLPDLHRLCNIMKTLILFNDHAIIETAVKDDIINGVVGALEYDPDFPLHKANHRQYLAKESKFKEVVRIENDEIRNKIHMTYRLQYMKDVVLARILDDSTFSVLNSLIYFHQIDIVTYITKEEAFIKELFLVITDPTQPQQRKKEAIVFVQQCCIVAKPFNGPTRASLYHNLVLGGLFPAIAHALRHHDASVRVAGTEILVAVIDHDVTIIRNYIYKAVNDKSKPLTDTLIELLLVESDLGIKAQVADAIKVLLEPITAPPVDRQVANESNGFSSKVRSQAVVSQQNDVFLQAFFDQSAKKLFQPLKDLEKRKSMIGLSVHEISLYSHLVEILCFFIRQHSYRSKIFILSEGIASRTAQLMQCPEKHMKLTAIKYFRAVLNLNDEHHNRQMVQHHLFEPILKLLIETMPRDNLLNSACLDLFEYIRKENIKALIYHLVESYRERLQTITFVDTFSGIILRYEQYENPGSILTSNGTDIDSSLMTSDADTPNPRHMTINGGASRWGQGLKDPDAEEDAYFNTSDEDEEEDELSRTSPLQFGGTSAYGSSSVRPSKVRLVSYGDDDEDDLASDLMEQADLLQSSLGPDVDDLTSSSSVSPLSGTSAALFSPATTPITTPPSTLAEKRRREEDEDEDELGKLATHRRRNSSASVSSVATEVSWDFVRTEHATTAPAATSAKMEETGNSSFGANDVVNVRSPITAKVEGSVEEKEKPAFAASVPTRTPSLRRKRAFNNSGQEMAKEKGKEKEKEIVKDTSTINSAKKIAFNLASRRATGDGGAN